VNPPPGDDSVASRTPLALVDVVSDSSIYTNTPMGGLRDPVGRSVRPRRVGAVPGDPVAGATAGAEHGAARWRPRSLDNWPESGGKRASFPKSEIAKPPSRRAGVRACLPGPVVAQDRPRGRKA
jgi:hypothetical protein